MVERSELACLFETCGTYLFEMCGTYLFEMCGTKRATIDPTEEADPQPRGEGETVARLHLAVLAGGAENLPPAHDQHDRQQNVHRVVQARLRVRRHGRGHEEETVDGAAAAEQLADEAGHGDLPVLLADERGHDAETHHEVARVAAEDHVAAGLVGVGEVDEVVDHECDDVGERDRGGNEPLGEALRNKWSANKGYRLARLSGLGSESRVTLKVMGRRMDEMAIRRKPRLRRRKSSFWKRREMATGTTATYMRMSPSAADFTDFRNEIGMYSL